MGKIEGIFKDEIVRLAKREMRKVFVPVAKDVRLLKGTVSQMRKTVHELERTVARQVKEAGAEKKPIAASPEEVKGSRFSPRLIRTLRERLGLTQRQLAKLAGVTVGAIYQWETGKFEPRGDKKAVLVALRKMGRREVKEALERNTPTKAEKVETRGKKKTPSKKTRTRKAPTKRVRRSPLPSHR
jgi:DNA-binding transcriptional regulator YiaG